MTEQIFALLGLAAVIGGGFEYRRYRRARDLAVALEIPSDALDDDESNFRSPWLEAFQATARPNRSSGDRAGWIGRLLEQARVPLRPSEAVGIAIGLAVIAFGLVATMTGSMLLGLIALVAAPAALVYGLRRKIAGRRKALREQLPEALSILSSSMASGHTLQRSLKSLAASGEAPLRDELAQVVAETQLGTSMVDAVRNMAERVELPEVVWLSRAMVIHYTLGGKLADLLGTLSEITYHRLEFEREIAALTAEGRMSAWVLGLLPLMLLVMIRITNATYLNPMFSGWGLVALAVCAVSVVFGVLMIRRMARIEV